jgi:hypothetical protein
MWLLRAVVFRYQRRIAWIAAIAFATVIYGMVDQSPRAELQTWYWPPLAGLIAFLIARLAIGRLFNALIGMAVRNLHH